MTQAGSNDTKHQRDRFLAFAFASADLLMEIDEAQNIIFAIGAVKGITGNSAEDLIGTHWLTLFAPHDQTTMQNIYLRAKPGHRQGPLLFDLNEDISTQKGLISGIRMPGSNAFYIAIAFSDILSAQLSDIMSDTNDGELLDKAYFTKIAEDAMIKAKAHDQTPVITIYDITPIEDDKERYGEEKWLEMTQGLGQLLIAGSIDGRSAAQIAEGRYGVIQESAEETAIIQEKMEAFSKTHDPEGRGISIANKTIEADLPSITAHDIKKALIYTVNEAERNGTKMAITSLNSGFETYVKANSEKREELKSYIERSEFSISFQPIVTFKTKTPDHFEMRCQFSTGNTQEWVTFGEDIGLVSAFDLGICDRAINYINFSASRNRLQFAINISSQSFEDPNFIKSLTALLDGHTNKNLQERMIIEITETNHIKDLKSTTTHIQELKDRGFKITLDDCKDDPAIMAAIKSIGPNAIKIDGSLVQKAGNSLSDLGRLKMLTEHCHKKNIQTIAKAIEDEKQIELLEKLGITMGQGYYFGRPQDKPEFLSQ